ncbi:MAG: hypothetical protein NZ561_02015 [Phycisphaerae bacterium]|nr:hypothetical protein [Phycisphaerae bacterium]MDW8262686.1 hypothetical protein [Phycisphaerales bacterium]
MSVFSPTADLQPRAGDRAVAADATGHLAHQVGCGERFISLQYGLAAILLGSAVAINDGRLHWLGLQWLALALLAMASGLILCRSAVAGRVQSSLLEIVLALGVAFQIVHLALMGVMAACPSNVPTFAIRLCMLTFTLGVLTALWRDRSTGTLLMIGAFLVAGWACIYSNPHPRIDVLEFQKHSAAALLGGSNPYGIRYRDIYEGHGTDFYGPGVIENGWLTYPFPYPPLSVLLVVPGQLIGDVRYAHLAAMAAAGALIAACAPGRLGILAAALLLTSPRALFLVQTGWTEPLLILLAAAVTWSALHCRRILWLALGLWLAVKQYLLLLIPLTKLLGPTLGSRRRWRQTMLAAGLVAAATIVPFLILDPQAFIRGVIQWQMIQPFRSDSLSFTALWAEMSGRPTEGLPGFITASLAMAVGLWKAPRSPGGFMAGAALVFAAFFAFNKQAFCNYYLFVTGVCCCAIAGLAADPTSRAATPVQE